LGTRINLAESGLGFSVCCPNDKRGPITEQLSGGRSGQNDTRNLLVKTTGRFLETATDVEKLGSWEFTNRTAYFI